MSGAEPYLAAAQLAMSTINNYQSGKAQAASYAQQAAAANQRAAYQRQLAAAEEQKKRKEFNSLLGKQRAQLAASGIDISQGSALLAQENSAADAEFEALMIRSTGAARATQLEQSARLSSMRASAANRSANFGLASSLLKNAPKYGRAFGIS